ncbi:hypothetical protein DWV16_07905 [Anaerotruncus sp. AF02-27]|nr:hypothetical protein DWV16_07905 [Anaerotruncus sp. AF02-27]
MRAAICALRAPGIAPQGDFLACPRKSPKKDTRGDPATPMRAVWLPAAKTARNLLRQNDVSRVIKSTRDGRPQPLRPRAVRKADKRIERTLRVQKSLPKGGDPAQM